MNAEPQAQQVPTAATAGPFQSQSANQMDSRAAQYVRMSTEHQRYSTENQSDAIAQYAERHNLSVVRTYTDKGRSGLRIDGRDALKQLIADAESGVADFRTILVYDVSRWGRFQDADESAYYEYVCRRAGLGVRYCAEQFENDGSIASTIVKTVKRAMAGEYSRELSVKVFAGQCRLVELGFRLGGSAGYGLRRRLINEHREPKDLLAPGERKSLQTDRVSLEPGPEEEVATVRRIFRMLVDDRRSVREITDILNREQVPRETGVDWTRRSVHWLLTSEKYIGNAVFNRVSFKLNKKRVTNPPEIWIRAQGAYPAIVDDEIFMAAQAILAKPRDRISDEEMLNRLKALHLAEGPLSRLIIDNAHDMPTSRAYQKRFGSLARAYTLMGIPPELMAARPPPIGASNPMHAKILADIRAGIEREGGTLAFNRATGMHTVNGEFTTSIVIVDCQKLPTGALRWVVNLTANVHSHITTAVRLHPDNEQPLDYYFLPGIDVSASRIRLAQKNGLLIDAYRATTLDRLFRLSGRTTLRFQCDRSSS